MVLSAHAESMTLSARPEAESIILSVGLITEKGWYSQLNSYKGLDGNKTLLPHMFSTLEIVY
jgi:hypothetical protein